MAINQRGYKWYVVDTNDLTIESGWENREDAEEQLDNVDHRALSGSKPYGVLSKQYLIGKGVDPQVDRNWKRTGGRSLRSNPYPRPARSPLGEIRLTLHNGSLALHIPVKVKTSGKPEEVAQAVIYDFDATRGSVGVDIGETTYVLNVELDSTGEISLSGNRFTVRAKGPSAEAFLEAALGMAEFGVSI